MRSIGKPEEGSKFALTDHDHRVIVLGVPHDSASRLEIILMDDPAVPVVRKLPPPDLDLPEWVPESSQGLASNDSGRQPFAFGQGWLDIPGIGLAIRFAYASRKREARVVGPA